MPSRTPPSGRGERPAGTRRASRLSRVCGRIATAAVVTSALVHFGFQSACGDVPLQPDMDAGTAPSEEAGHPPPGMYGSPCIQSADGPELCCGDIAKRMRADECYGCTGKAAYALCINGAYTCACTCEVPEGYTLLGRGNEPDCSVPEASPDVATPDGEAESGEGGEGGESEASTDAPVEAPASDGPAGSEPDGA